VALRGEKVAICPAWLIINLLIFLIILPPPGIDAVKKGVKSPAKMC